MNNKKIMYNFFCIYKNGKQISKKTKKTSQKKHAKNIKIFLENKKEIQLSVQGIVIQHIKLNF